jgi:hypothetical protein
MENRARAAVAVLAALTALSCNAFRRSGPDAPTEVVPPLLVDVVIEYRQPNECVDGSPRCLDNVSFFGNWMRPGEEFFLTPDAGRFIWRGVARRVPVNFPPRDNPHFVRVYDPHMVGSPTQGASAERLKVGGESITRFFAPGGVNEFGLVYIDQNGLGHTPFF